jgi:hypothetical protein
MSFRSFATRDGISMTVGSVVAAIILLIGVSAGSRAADIQETDNALCAFRLEGVISPGDHERFSDLIQRDLGKIDSYDERTSTICLRSMGGAYNEASKIAELMYSRGVSAAIEYGSKCFSACALILMAGIEHRKILPFRKLSAGGVLGFHAPYLTMPDQKIFERGSRGPRAGHERGISWSCSVVISKDHAGGRVPEEEPN